MLNFLAEQNSIRKWKLFLVDLIDPAGRFDFNHDRRVFILFLAVTLRSR